MPQVRNSGSESLSLICEDFNLWEPRNFLLDDSASLFNWKHGPDCSFWSAGGDFGGDRGPARIRPNREAEEGTASRPGVSTHLASKMDAMAKIEEAISSLPDAMKVCFSSLQ